MEAKLVCLDARGPKDDFVLSEFPVVVGRDADADVRIDDGWVSRMHCLIDLVEGALVVRDLGSRHGTYVNGGMVGESPLLPGNTLTIGCSTFAVAYERGADDRPSFLREVAGFLHSPREMWRRLNVRA